MKKEGGDEDVWASWHRTKGHLVMLIEGNYLLLCSHFPIWIFHMEISLTIRSDILHDSLNLLWLVRKISDLEALRLLGRVKMRNLLLKMVKSSL